MTLARPALVLALIALAAGPVQAQRTLLGYSAEASVAQRGVEEALRNTISAASISALHRPLARRPHPAASLGSREVVRYLERTLRSFGFEVERHEYQAWLSTADRVQVSLTAPTARALRVREPSLAKDPTSSHPELGDAYIAYSGSGDVEAEVVYVNYGLPADYAELARLGVPTAGRIALARYGRSHRAVKAYLAQEAGARALVLYSDPADDGVARGPAWPDGYWRGEDMPQRGNAKLSWYFHGDPLTPGVAATAGASRLDPSRAPTLPHIPVVALGWGEARHILAALGGPEAPASFRGAVPGTTYHVGPGPARTRVQVRMRDGLRPIQDVVATLRGRSQPDRMVLLGGHHDAWTFGGVDPGTGAAALLEVARTLGQRARTGWRPERTIAIAFWDAEEYGLVGSTEYVEQFRRQLAQQLVLYVNIDMYMRGRFDPGGVPSLRALVADVARDVPSGTGSVYDAWRASEWARLPADRRPDSSTFEPALKALGSGADFVPFQDHLGAPTLALEFIGANGYGFGTYHTTHDSRAYVEQVADPGFAQGVTMARTLATLAVRVANAQVLPFRPRDYADYLRAAVTGVEGTLRSAGAPLDARLALGVRDRTDTVLALARRLEGEIDRRLAGPVPARAESRTLDDLLARAEQLLTDDDGAPDRAWYRHVVHGWDIYSLYDGQPFPGLVDAVRARDPARVARELGRIERALDRYASALREATGILAPGPR